MRLVLASVSVLAIACGSSSKATVDAPSGDGASGDGTQGSGGDDGSVAGGGTAITVTLNHRPTNAAMFSFVVAYQDGSGTWQLAPAPTGDAYTFHVNAPSWGVVWTCIGGSGANGGQIRQVAEAHFAVSERTSLAMDVPNRCTDAAPGTVALTGTVANRSGGLYVVDFGGKAAIVNPTTGTYHVEAVPGTHDLILRHVQTSGGFGGDVATTETVVERAVAVTGATVHDLDAANTIATTSYNVNVMTQQQQARITAQTVLYSAGGTTSTLDRVTQNFESDVLNDTQAVTGDVYDQQISVSAAGQTAIVTNATATPGDQTFNPPASLGGAASDVAASMPYPIVHTTWNAYDSTVGYAWTAAQTPTFQQCGGNTPCTIVWSALLSPGVTGASPGYQMPDLSALTGWSADLAFVTGATITGYAEAATSSAGASDFPPVTPPAAGTQRTYARSAFTVTP